MAVNILVTGGSGFIGGHVVSQLRTAGHEVRSVDRRPPPWGGGEAPDSAASALAPVEVITGDLRDPTVVARAVCDIDAVCHLAAMVGVSAGFDDVGDYVADNDLVTSFLLRGLWQTGFRGRLVLASSMVVYGDGLCRCDVHGVFTPTPRRAEDLAAGRFDAPCPIAGCGRATGWVAVDEEAPLDPRSVYAATKVHQEQLCRLWGRESGATVVALRYHNVYGPGMPRNTPYAGVASIFGSALARGAPPEVFEDGAQTRDFIDVRDVAAATVLALTRPGVASGPLNVASGTPHTVAELALALATGSGSAAPLPIVTGKWRLGDVRHIVASPERAAAVLGFVARVSLAEGMAELAAASRRGAGDGGASPPAGPAPWDGRSDGRSAAEAPGVCR